MVIGGEARQVRVERRALPEAGSRIAHHVTGDARYDTAAATLVSRHGYAMNLLHPKVSLGVGGGNQSDDEMAFMNYYHLLKYERDPVVRH